MKKGKGRPINYKLYLKERKALSKKGYILDDAMSMKDYKETYHLAKDAGVTNIAKTIAREDITIDREFARNLLKAINKQKKLNPAFYKKIEAIFPKHKSQADLMKTDLKGLAARNPIDGKEAVSKKQAFFFEVWTELGSIVDANAFFGY